jgi:hypothetical protein
VYLYGAFLLINRTYHNKSKVEYKIDLVTLPWQKPKSLRLLLLWTEEERTTPRTNLFDQKSKTAFCWSTISATTRVVDYQHTWRCEVCYETACQGCCEEIQGLCNSTKNMTICQQQTPKDGQGWIGLYHRRSWAQSRTPEACEDDYAESSTVYFARGKRTPPPPPPPPSWHVLDEGGHYHKQGMSSMSFLIWRSFSFVLMYFYRDIIWKCAEFRTAEGGVILLCPKCQMWEQ